MWVAIGTISTTSKEACQRTKPSPSKSIWKIEQIDLWAVWVKLKQIFSTPPLLLLCPSSLLLSTTTRHSNVVYSSSTSTADFTSCSSCSCASQTDTDTCHLAVDVEARYPFSVVMLQTHHPFLVVSGNGEWEWWLLNSWAPPPFTHPFWVLQCWLTAAPIFSVGIGLLTPQRSASTSTMKCNVECWHTRTLDTPDGDGWWQWQDFCCLDLCFLVVCCML